MKFTTICYIILCYVFLRIGNEKKYIIFEKNLLQLFMVCPACLGQPCSATIRRTGTFIEVHQFCLRCKHLRNRCSQPRINESWSVIYCLQIVNLFSFIYLFSVYIFLFQEVRASGKFTVVKRNFIFGLLTSEDNQSISFYRNSSL